MILSLGTSLGCGADSSGPKTVSASGVLTLDGAPVAEAQVILVDVKGVPAYATSDKNGKFSLMVSDTKKGAVPGTYPVIVTKTKMDDLGGGNVRLEQGLPDQYGDPAKSGVSDRGREVRLGRTPLPPNRTGGFPAYGSPVSSCPDGIGRNEGEPLAD